MTPEQTLHHQFCQQAKNHYEEISTKCCNYNSTVAKAIEFYEKYGPVLPSKGTESQSMFDLPHAEQIIDLAFKGEPIHICGHKYVVESKGMVEKEYCVICGKEANVFQLSEGWRCIDHALIGVTEGNPGKIECEHRWSCATTGLGMQLCLNLGCTAQRDAPKERSMVSNYQKYCITHSRWVDDSGCPLCPKLSSAPLVLLDNMAVHALAMTCWQENEGQQIFMVPKFIHELCTKFGAQPSRTVSVEIISGVICQHFGKFCMSGEGEIPINFNYIELATAIHALLKEKA